MARFRPGLEPMDFEEFARRAKELYEEIPGEFRRDVTGVVVHRKRVDHPHIPDYWTLGECAPASPLEGETGFRSTVHLYHGSFRALARGEPGFDWEGELWETLTHEVRHHLEDRAGMPDLRDMDYAEEQDAARRSGRRCDPFFYRQGEEIAHGEFLVGRDLFVEVALTPGGVRRLGGGPLRVRFGGEELETPLPEARVGVHFIPIEGGWEDDEGLGGELTVVVVFSKGWSLPGRTGTPGGD